jgi:hypothetical protein
MRYSDILLMYAEAIAEGATEVGSITGEQALNKVYKRSNKGAADLALTVDNVRNQRALEFVGENIRKYDLMRWGQFSSQIKLANANTYGSDKVWKFVYYIDPSISQNSSIKALNVWWGRDDEVAAPVVGDEITVDGVNYKVFQDEVKAFSKKRDAMYKCSDEELENRQFWPIFDVIKNANYKLENYYGY